MSFARSSPLPAFPPPYIPHKAGSNHRSLTSRTAFSVAGPTVYKRTFKLFNLVLYSSFCAIAGADNADDKAATERWEVRIRAP